MTEGLLRHGRTEVPGSPSNLNTGNRIEGATGCPSWCRPLRPLFHFLCTNLKANPVHIKHTIFVNYSGTHVPTSMWTHSLSAGNFHLLWTLLHQRATIPGYYGSLASPGRHLAVANTHTLGSRESKRREEGRRGEFSEGGRKTSCSSLDGRNFLRGFTVSLSLGRPPARRQPG